MATEEGSESLPRITDLNTSRLLGFYLCRFAFGCDILRQLLVHLGAQLDGHVLPNAKFLLLVHGDVGQARDWIAPERLELLHNTLGVPVLCQGQLGHRINVVGLGRLGLQSPMQVIDLFNSPLPPMRLLTTLSAVRVRPGEPKTRHFLTPLPFKVA